MSLEMFKILTVVSIPRNVAIPHDDVIADLSDGSSFVKSSI